jgi:hypothetical protein
VFFLGKVLEIYPMKSITDINPTSDCLGQILNKALADVKEKLEIGRLN